MVFSNLDYNRSIGQGEELALAFANRSAVLGNKIKVNFLIKTYKVDIIRLNGKAKADSKYTIT